MTNTERNVAYGIFEKQKQKNYCLFVRTVNIGPL